MNYHYSQLSYHELGQWCHGYISAIKLSLVLSQERHYKFSPITVWIYRHLRPKRAKRRLPSRSRANCLWPKSRAYRESLSCGECTWPVRHCRIERTSKDCDIERFLRMCKALYMRYMRKGTSG